MAFGDSSVLLSSFTGSDENPLSEGGDWTSDSNDLQRLSNAITGGSANPCHSWWVPDYWPASTYISVYATWTTVGGHAEENEQRFATLATQGGAADGYEAFYSFRNGGNNDRARIYRLDAGAFTLLNSDDTLTFTDGDKYGFEMNPTTGAMAIYADTGGGWSSIVSTTDTTYDEDWFLDLFIQNTSSVWDDVYQTGAVAIQTTPVVAVMPPPRGY